MTSKSVKNDGREQEPNHNMMAVEQTMITSNSKRRSVYILLFVLSLAITTNAVISISAFSAAGVTAKSAPTKQQPFSQLTNVNNNPVHHAVSINTLRGGSDSYLKALAARGGDQEEIEEFPDKESLPTTTATESKTPSPFPWRQRIPNYLTYLRCIAIPFVVYLFYQPFQATTASNDKLLLFASATSSVFALASLTDFLDGYLARRWKTASAFGAFLDPVADKLMVSTSLVLLAGRHGAAVGIPTAIILARELAVSALREWMAQRQLRHVVKVGWQGKAKTALTMIVLTILLFLSPFQLALQQQEEVATVTKLMTLTQQWWRPSIYALYLCAVLTVTSGSVYFRAAAPVLMGKE